MSEWNFNLDEAPKGEYVTKTLKSGEVRYVHDPVSLIMTDGKIVTVSRWLPPITHGPRNKRPERNGRWNMFATYETPMAWMPWPEPPAREGDAPQWVRERPPIVPEDEIVVDGHVYVLKEKADGR